MSKVVFGRDGSYRKAQNMEIRAKKEAPQRDTTARKSTASFGRKEVSTSASKTAFVTSNRARTTVESKKVEKQVDTTKELNLASAKATEVETQVVEKPEIKEETKVIPVEEPAISVAEDDVENLVEPEVVERQENIEAVSDDLLSQLGLITSDRTNVDVEHPAEEPEVNESVVVPEEAVSEETKVEESVVEKQDEPVVNELEFEKAFENKGEVTQFTKVPLSVFLDKAGISIESFHAWVLRVFKVSTRSPSNFYVNAENQNVRVYSLNLSGAYIEAYFGYGSAICCGRLDKSKAKITEVGFSLNETADVVRNSIGHVVVFASDTNGDGKNVT